MAKNCPQCSADMVDVNDMNDEDACIWVCMECDEYLNQME